MPPIPRIRLQTGTLYASNDESWFSGTGGPWGFSPWTSEFGGVITSDGLSAEPFEDIVHNVAAGDEVIFVIAVENVAVGAAAWDVAIRGVIPSGFVLPREGSNLSVTDGAGTDLPFAGDLFGRDGLSIPVSLAPWDADTGRNIALVTYSLQAGPGTPAPNASLNSAVKLAHLAAMSGGPDLAAASPADARTTVVTAAPTPLVVALTDPGAVSRGQMISFDVSLPVPQGTIRDLRVETVFPLGTANLSLISAAVTGIGAGLTLPAPQVGPDGSVSLGTIVNLTATGDAAVITLRLVVRAEGTASGSASLQTIVSAANPDHPGVRWATSVETTVGVLVPPAPPVILDVLTQQQATTATLVNPFAGVSFTADNSGATAQDRTATMAITLQDAGLGRFDAPSRGSLDATGGSYIVTGTLAELQTAARNLVFHPEMAGMARFTITVIDASGGVAQDTNTMVSIAYAPMLAEVSNRIALDPIPKFLLALANPEPPRSPYDHSVPNAPLATLDPEVIGSASTNSAHLPTDERLPAIGNTSSTLTHGESASLMAPTATAVIGFATYTLQQTPGFGVEQFITPTL